MAQVGQKQEDQGKTCWESVEVELGAQMLRFLLDSEAVELNNKLHGSSPDRLDGKVQHHHIAIALEFPVENKSCWSA